MRQDSSKCNYVSFLHRKTRFNSLGHLQVHNFYFSKYTDERTKSIKCDKNVKNMMVIPENNMCGENSTTVS
jgi:hypothetical protein